MKVIITIILASLNLGGFARTFVVNPGSSLKKAVAQSQGGDTILIKAGSYAEGNILVTHPLVIIGIGEVVLDGQKKTELLTISTHDVVVKNISFINAGYSALNDYAAIKLVDAQNILLESNTVTNAYFAIHVSNSTGCIIRKNRIIGSPRSEQLTGNGIHLWKCQQALVENNYITGHRDGIYFEFVTNSLIRSNTSEKNIRYGLHFMFSHSDTYESNVFRNNGAGVAVMYSKKVVMISNHFEENWGPAAYGILLKEITDGKIDHNYFLKNTVGIHMEGSSRMEVAKNTFHNNGWAIRVQASCDDNRFLQNNFSSNSFDVATNGSISLNIFESNYWDKYDGYDINRDGFGDVPYHPVSMYSMVVEQNPNTLILLRSFLVSLLDKTEKAIPSLTPDNLIDNKPAIKPNKL